MKTITYTVGRLLCGEVRDFLNSLAFKGFDISYHESKGFIEREFIIKGEKEDLRKIYIFLRDYENHP